MKQVDCWQVYCINPECIIYKANDGYYQTEEDAADAWNRRDGENAEILRPVEGDGNGEVRRWQREIMDRDRALSGDAGSSAAGDGQE